MRCSGVACWRWAKADEAGTRASAASAAKPVAEGKIFTDYSPRLSNDATVPWLGLAADESYSPVVFVAGGGGGAAVGGAGAVVAGAGAGGRLALGLGAGGGAAVDAAGAGAAGCPVRSRSAGSKLTSRTVVEGGPTGGTTVFPTVILSASALPVFSSGAVAVGGTVNVCPGCNIPEKRVAPPFSLT